MASKIIKKGIRIALRRDGERDVILLLDNIKEANSPPIDNFVFFEYLFNKKGSSFTPYYVINKDCSEYRDIKKAYGDQIIEYSGGELGIKAQIKLLLISKRLRFVCDSFQQMAHLGLGFRESIDRYGKVRKIFTQHGITFFKPEYINEWTYGHCHKSKSSI